MPKFQNREEYERWKAEKMQKGAQTPPEMKDDRIQEKVQAPPEMVLGVLEEEEKKKTGIYKLLVVLVVIALSVFIIYKQFFQEETWTDTSYTNWKIGFSMDIPEGWDEYDFAFGEKAILKMQMPSGGKILFTLAPENRRDTAYTLAYMDTEKLSMSMANDRLNFVMKSLASAMSGQNYKVERFEETIAGIDIPFVRGTRGEEIFIIGSFLLPEKLFMAEFHNLTGEYEEEFWESIESFELLED